MLKNIIEHAIKFSEVDSLRVVWHGHYVRYFEEVYACICDKCEINIPKKLHHLALNLKKEMPTSNVNKGVSELSIPALLLFRPVCAIAKRKAGKKLPIIPAKANTFQSSRFIDLKRLNARGDNAIKVMIIRREPN